jgi:hypothetical protein
LFSAALKQKEYPLIFGYPFFANGFELISYVFNLLYLHSLCPDSNIFLITIFF